MIDSNKWNDRSYQVNWSLEDVNCKVVSIGMLAKDEFKRIDQMLPDEDIKKLKNWNGWKVFFCDIQRKKAFQFWGCLWSMVLDTIFFLI